MSEKINKTNAMRILDKNKIDYSIKTYPVDENDLSGEHVALQLGLNPDCVFKTLVLHGDKTGYVVACIPVAATLNLKAVAKASHNKSVEMIHVKELMGITGYIRGGCSPVGMKKKFPTFFHQTILDQDTVYLSGGKRGMQIVLSPKDIITVTNGETADIIQ